MQDAGANTIQERPEPHTARRCAARVVGEPSAEPTAATRRLYAGDWAHFAAWCRLNACAPLPATTATFAAYLLAAAPGLSRGTLGRRRAAIGTMHRQSGQPIPRLDAATQAILRATARPKTAPSVPPTSAGLQRLASKCPRDLPGLRDRALLLDAIGAFLTSELALL